MALGRPKAFKSPDEVWGWFVKYKQWVEENPIKIEDYVGKDANRVYREKPRALTMEGFDNFLYDNNVVDNMAQYFANREERYTDFVPICSRIRFTIRQNQIEGGLAGIFNPSITQRLNSLVEKTDTNVTGTTIINFIEQEGNEPIK
jgi:hypothetical protein